MQIGGSKDPEYQQAHAFSIYLVQPLIATSLALFSFNWYWSCHALVSSEMKILSILIHILVSNRIQYIPGILLLFLLVTHTHTLLEWLWQLPAFWAISGVNLQFSGNSEQKNCFWKFLKDLKLWTFFAC